jgi:hypothetical protein
LELQHEQSGNQMLLVRQFVAKLRLHLQSALYTLIELIQVNHFRRQQRQPLADEFYDEGAALEVVR